MGCGGGLTWPVVGLVGGVVLSRNVVRVCSSWYASWKGVVGDRVVHVGRWETLPSQHCARNAADQNHAYGGVLLFLLGEEVTPVWELFA